MNRLPFGALFFFGSALVAVGCGAPQGGSEASTHGELSGGLSVTGRVVFEPGSVIPAAWQTKPASGVVTVLDTSLQDAPSVEIARVAFTVKDGSPVPFDVPVSGIQPNRTYTVSAHLDADGDAKVSEGDFVSTESFPVLTGGHDATVDVRIERVGAAVTSGVSGRVLLAGELSGLTFPFDGVVEVNDVSLQDAPSVTVGKQRIQVTGPGPIPFFVPVTGIDPRADYSVRVHLDTDGDAKVSKGDFLTVESFPVLTHGYGSVIDVTAKRY